MSNETIATLIITMILCLIPYRIWKKICPYSLHIQKDEIDGWSCTIIRDDEP